jgi:thymidylate kinase
MIFFEGLDRIGKTTVKKELEKLTNYKYIAFDRGHLSAICYEKLKERGNDLRYYESQFSKLRKEFKILVIYLRIDEINIIKQRVVNEKEEILLFDEVEKLSKIFDNYIYSIYNKNEFLIKSVDNYLSVDRLKILAKEIVQELCL